MGFAILSETTWVWAGFAAAAAAVVVGNVLHIRDFLNEKLHMRESLKLLLIHNDGRTSSQWARASELDLNEIWVVFVFVWQIN